MFTILVAKLPEFVYDRKKSFRDWLRKILHNKWRDRQRRLAAEPTLQTAGALVNEASPVETDTFWEIE